METPIHKSPFLMEKNKKHHHVWWKNHDCLVVLTSLKNMKVSWDYYSKCVEKWSLYSNHHPPAYLIHHYQPLLTTIIHHHDTTSGFMVTTSFRCYYSISSRPSRHSSTITDGAAEAEAFSSTCRWKSMEHLWKSGEHPWTSNKNIHV